MSLYPAGLQEDTVGFFIHQTWPCDILYSEDAFPSQGSFNKAGWNLASAHPFPSGHISILREMPRPEQMGRGLLRWVDGLWFSLH